MCKEPSKLIVFFRHGHALNVAKDFLRPLSILGRHEVKSNAKKLVEHEFDAVFSSSSIRTMQTANIVREELSIEKDVVLVKKLYEIDQKNLKEFISGFSEEYEKVIIVGHNPAISFLHSKALVQGDYYLVAFTGKWQDIWDKIYAN